MRVADGEPGVECQIDFGQLGMLIDADDGRRRKVHALIFTAVYSRHMFVWLSYSQTLAAVIAGCEAAWEFFGGVFEVLIPDNLKPVVADADAVNPQFVQGGWTMPSTPGSSPTRPGCARRRTSRGWSGRCSTCAATSGPGKRSSIWPGAAGRDERGVVTPPGRGSTAPPRAPAGVFAAEEQPQLLPVPGVYDVPMFNR